jgi:2-polyprenyl-3-methyl-5-hydroxy-6-metoxy-1,4-benzoquinol methylase
MDASAEINNGERFEFGKNWSALISQLSTSDLISAEEDLTYYLGEKSINIGNTFLDIGSGSGLTSAAASRLGFNVTSMDFDNECVSATRTLRKRFGELQPNVIQGSVLDVDFMNSLGKYDVVCSWGVLHHTGDLWGALDAAVNAVNAGGRLYIALYNYQDLASSYWKFVKKLYVSKGRMTKKILLLIHGAYFTFRDLFWATLSSIRSLSISPLKSALISSRERGMRKKNDLIDWVGGYPFEPSRPEEVFNFVGPEFKLLKIKTCGAGHGCNIFVFEKEC